MAADLEMGSLRVEMRKRFCVWEVVAAPRESGLGKGSSREVMWFVIFVLGDGGSWRAASFGWLRRMIGRGDVQFGDKR